MIVLGLLLGRDGFSPSLPKDCHPHPDCMWASTRAELMARSAELTVTRVLGTTKLVFPWQASSGLDIGLATCPQELVFVSNREGGPPELQFIFWIPDLAILNPTRSARVSDRPASSYRPSESGRNWDYGRSYVVHLSVRAPLGRANRAPPLARDHGVWQIFAELA